jgi:hypothetical protein
MLPQLLQATTISASKNWQNARKNLIAELEDAKNTESARWLIKAQPFNDSSHLCITTYFAILILIQNVKNCFTNSL